MVVRRAVDRASVETAMKLRILMRKRVIVWRLFYRSREEVMDMEWLLRAVAEEDDQCMDCLLVMPLTKPSLYSQRF